VIDLPDNANQPEAARPEDEAAPSGEPPREPSAVEETAAVKPEAVKPEAVEPETEAPASDSESPAPIETPETNVAPEIGDAPDDVQASKDLQAEQEPAGESPADDAVSDDEPDEDDEDVAPIEEISAEDESESGEREWYILKVQTNREDTIREALIRRAKLEGLEHFFGEVIVPTETVTEFKGGKKRVVKRKLYPGYIVVNMVINDDTWFLVRDTPGIGDFTGAAGKPVPMLPQEVNRIIATEEETTDETPKLKIGFKQGDRIKINEGTFESFEGDVEKIDEANGKVTVMINIFGRSTPVELEYWQVETV